MNLLDSIKTLGRVAVDRLESEADDAVASVIASVSGKPVALVASPAPVSSPAPTAQQRPAWVVPAAVGVTVLFLGALGWAAVGRS